MSQAVPLQDEGWRGRCSARLRRMMEILAGESKPIFMAELQDRISVDVPLTDYDSSKTATGATRAWVNLGWNSSGFQHAGWLHVSDPGLRITRQGRAALVQYPTPGELFDASESLYKQWDLSRKEQLPDRSVDPTSEVVHAGSAVAHTLRASGAFLVAWRESGSALEKDAHAWTELATTSLMTYLEAVTQPVAPTLPGLADDSARLLAAELLGLVLPAFAGNSPTLKRKRVRNPLLFLPDPPCIPSEISADFDHGFVPAGQLATTDATALLRMMTSVLGYWWTQPLERRELSWQDPWIWRDLLAEVEVDDESLVGLLCLLAHPGAFTTVLRREDRLRIVAAFPEFANESTGDVDRDLLAITLALQAQQNGLGVRFEEPPWAQRWTGQPEATTAWLIRGEVDKDDLIQSWLGQDIVTISVGRLTQLPAEISQGALGVLIDQLYGDFALVKREAKKRDVWSFVLGMKPMDLVATVDGGTLLLGRLMDGPAERSSVTGSIVLKRSVTWSPEASPEIALLPEGLRKRLRFAGEDVVNLSEVNSPLQELLDIGSVPDVGPGTKPVPKSEPVGPARVKLECDIVALSAVLHHADTSWLQELFVSLNERRQVIVEGPPGAGKTYLVRALVAACKLTEGQQALVQFHPTYSYEDFVEGFRPVSNIEGAMGVALAVAPGPLRRIADEARKAPGKPFILIIDEINRANIAKVFGELYFLLEYRDAEIELLYSDGKERFSLPDNLFIVGTMNTADRSIALLDSAMRRRFVFLSMDMGEPALAGVLKRWCLSNATSVGVAGLLDRINTRMVDRGLDRSLAFGPSYFMRADIGDPAVLDRVWRRELLPMLREHHFDSQAELPKWYPFASWLEEFGFVHPPTVLPNPQ